MDTLVFSGGMGENSPPIRSRICDGLEFLGVTLDEKQNAANASVISCAGNRVSVRVIPTDEELMIAKSVCRALTLAGAFAKGAPAMQRTTKQKPGKEIGRAAGRERG